MKAELGERLKEGLGGRARLGGEVSWRWTARRRARRGVRIGESRRCLRSVRAFEGGRWEGREAGGAAE